MTVDAPDAPPLPGGDSPGSPGAGAPGSGPGHRRWRPGRLVTGGVVLALVAMWGYVLYLAFGPGRQPPIDRLDDPSFAEAAEQRCAEALDRIDRLPVASATPDAADRAEVLDEATGIYAAMVDDLERLTRLVPDAAQRTHAREWVADWRTHLGDRRAYAQALRRDPDARLLVSEKPGEGRQITGWIDEFARANRMPACISPTDA